MSKNPIYCSCVICKNKIESNVILNHFRIVHTIEGAEENRKTLLKAKSVSAKNKIKRIEKYNDNPNRCINCNNAIQYNKRQNKFCSKSCAATFNNTGRKVSDAQKEKTSRTLKNTIHKPKSTIRKSGNAKKFCVVCFHNCIICNKTILSKSGSPKRKTCSRECQIHASVGNRHYINGTRRNIYYRKGDETILLESSWEEIIAKFLDENNIEWERPKPVKWFDENTQKSRLYYPDFFLPNKNIFLDPKNPYAMMKDEYKLSVVTKKINLIYGDVEEIKKKLSLLFGLI